MRFWTISGAGWGFIDADPGAIPIRRIGVLACRRPTSSLGDAGSCSSHLNQCPVQEARRLLAGGPRWSNQG